MKCRFVLDTPNAEYILLRDQVPQVGDIINTYEYDSFSYRITEVHMGVCGNRSRREYYGCLCTCKGEEIK